MMLGELSATHLSTHFNINKQLAMKYLQFAIYSPETEKEAEFKIAEFMFHGTSGHQSYKEALTIYK
jgi:hypothetical protein